MNYLTDGTVKKEWMNINANSLISDSLLLGSGGTQSGEGNLLIGIADSDSTLAVSQTGSITSGEAITFGTLTNTGESCLLVGKALDQSLMQSAGDGNICFGYADGSSSKIFSSNNGSLAGGQCTSGGLIEATGSGSVVFGHAQTGGEIKSSQTASLVVGYTAGASELTQASAINSFALGRDVQIPVGNNHSLLLGKHGGALTSNSITPETIDGECSIQIAGGVSSSATTSIAMTIGVVTFSDTAPEGAIVTDHFNVIGVLKSSYFETEDEELIEDSIGTIVTLDKGKLRICENDNDHPLGVICDKSGICSDTQERVWKGICHKDKFGRKVRRNTFIKYFKKILKEHNVDIDDKIREYLIQDDEESKLLIIDHLNHLNEDVSIRDKHEMNYHSLLKQIRDCESIEDFVENIDFDPSKEYLSRRNRPEWMTVAYDCKVPVKCSEDVSIEDYVSIENGIAIKGDKYAVLEKLADDVCVILFK